MRIATDLEGLGVQSSQPAQCTDYITGGTAYPVTFKTIMK